MVFYRPRRDYFGPEDVHFGHLIRILSTPIYQPNGQCIRNHLLAGITARSDPLQRLPSDGDDEWATLQNHQPGTQVAIFGHPPHGIFQENVKLDCSKPDAGDIWGIATLMSSKFRDTSDPTTFFRRPNVSIWLSSECESARRRLAAGGDAPDIAKIKVELDAASRDLFRSIIVDWLPQAYSTFIAAQQSRVEVNAEELAHLSHEVDVIVQALDATLRDALLALAADSQEAGTSLVKVDWHAPYLAFGLDVNEGQSNDVAGSISSAEVRRWNVQPLAEDSVQTVIAANHLPFPRQHILRKPWLSVTLRDNQEVTNSGGNGGNKVQDLIQHNPDSDLHVTEQECGALAGWCYTHEDLSLASLYVVEAYRRLPPPGVSVGRLIVQILSRKIAETLRQTLIRVGVDPDEFGHQDTSEKNWCPWLVKADVDVNSEGAIKFYERVGFRRMAYQDWLGLKVSLPWKAEDTQEKTDAESAP